MKSNPSWSTEESPAGKMCDLGCLMKIPKTNVLLTFSVAVDAIKNGKVQTYIFFAGQ
jgi:hypothetical protein